MAYHLHRINPRKTKGGYGFIGRIRDDRAGADNFSNGAAGSQVFYDLYFGIPSTSAGSARQTAFMLGLTTGDGAFG